MHSGFISRLTGALALPLLFALGACEQTSSIGQSVIDEQIDIIIDSAFTVSGNSVRNDNVQSRTLTQLLGDIEIEGYGSVRSYFVSQFMPAANIQTDGVTSIDSLHLIMRVPTGDYIGDSIAPMGLTVYELERDLPYPIYTNTELNDYYNTNAPVGSRIYTMANFRLDSVSSTESATYRELKVPLDLSIGKRLYDAYVANPSAFSDPATFTSQIFKGLAVQNSFGSGRLTRIGQSTLRMYYTRKFYSEKLERDSMTAPFGQLFRCDPGGYYKQPAHLHPQRNHNRHGGKRSCSYCIACRLRSQDALPGSGNSGQLQQQQSSVSARKQPVHASACFGTRQQRRHRATQVYTYGTQQRQRQILCRQLAARQHTLVLRYIRLHQPVL